MSTRTKLLFIINGGLGDAAELTHTLYAANALGYDVHVLAWSGNARCMDDIWRLMPWLTVTSRERARTVEYAAVLCATNHSTLEQRASGLRTQRLENGEPLPRAHIVHNNQRLLYAMGHADADQYLPPPGAFRHLLPLGITPDAILLAPGVGTCRSPEGVESKSRKLYNRWPELLRYLRKPIVLVGDSGAAFPWTTVALDGVQNLIGKTPSVTDLLPLFARARMLVAPDNGIHHLARLFDVPTVSLWTGETLPQQFNARGAIPLDARTVTPGEIANQLHLFDHPECRDGLLPDNGPTLSVVIATFNEGDEVRLTIDDVTHNAGCPVEIIIVDDGSTDASCSALPPDVRLIRVPEKTGVAASRNLGAAASTGAALLFLDAHMRLAPGAGRVLRDAALARPCVAVAGQAALYNAVRQPVYTSGWAWDAPHARIHSVWRHTRPADEFKPSASWVAPGWCLSRQTWDTIGPWPRGLRNWGSTEVTMSLRANLAGIPILACRDALTWHQFRPHIPYASSPAAIQRNACVCAYTSFGPDTFERLLRRPMGTDWQPDPDTQADAAAFAERRAIDPEAWLRANIPDLFAAAPPAALPTAPASSGISVPPAGSFAAALARILTTERPQRIIETGTHKGTGSTAVICAHIAPDANFVSIECDRAYHAAAVRNLAGQPVLCWLGLSLRRTLLPDAAETRQILTTPAHIKHDASDIEREVAHRLAEVDRKDVPDGLLDAAVRYHGCRPDFVLLDSAGHVGFIEFQLLLALLQGPCTIALDDVQHVKHWKSFELARTDPRFTIESTGTERNGWAILHFRTTVSDPGAA